jgi:chromosome segregation ATPase
LGNIQKLDDLTTQLKEANQLVASLQDDIKAKADQTNEGSQKAEALTRQVGDVTDKNAELEKELARALEEVENFRREA